MEMPKNEMILPSNKIVVDAEEIDNVCTFTKGRGYPKKPNYAQWYDTRAIDITLPQHVLFGIYE